MPHYFFHIWDGTRFLKDEEGQDFETFEEAQEEATEGARDILGEAVKRGAAATLNKQIEVVDQSGETVLVGHVTGTPNQT